MGVFAFLSYSSRPVEVDDVKPSEIPVVAVVDDEKNSVAAEPVLETVPAPIPTIVVSKPSRILKPPSVASFSSLSSSSRRFSLPAMPFTRHVASDPKPVLSTVHEHAKISSAASSFFKRAIRLSNSDKRAKKSALVVRALIIGPSASSFSSSRSTPAAPKLTLTSANARPQLNKLKSQLLEPKSANKVIAHLRALPVEDDHGARAPRGPIHAVCLEHADADEERLHFATLTVTSTADTSTARTKTNQTDMTVQASFFDAPLALDTVTDMFSKMNVVSLISAPGLGLGSSGDQTRLA
ncbi:hypothetical protein C0991_002745 [Blastosporella zonata]|nr:hypothetical protein C0991_002745 [Blastosporella zonata]